MMTVEQIFITGIYFLCWLKTSLESGLWPLKNYDKTTLLSVQEEKKENIDDNLCMVCLDKESNTMVLPCEHCVVCKECSMQLENTFNSLKCVKCRQAIKFKLY